MLEVKQFTFGPFQTNCYVIGLNDTTANEQTILVLDPACSNEYEQQMLLDCIDNLQSKNINSKLQIVATHGHLDHLWGAAWATDKWQTPVRMHEADIPMAEAMQAQYDLFGIPGTPEPFPIKSLTDEVGLTVQRSVSEAVCQCNGLSILSTPGHTPGCICLYFPEEKMLFSGDTLFRMGYGRTDLPGGNIGQLIRSLERLMELPADVRVYPGHGEFTTIGAERR